MARKSFISSRGDLFRRVPGIRGRQELKLTISLCHLSVTQAPGPGTKNQRNENPRNGFRTELTNQRGRRVRDETVSGIPFSQWGPLPVSGNVPVGRWFGGTVSFLSLGGGFAVVLGSRDCFFCVSISSSCAEPTYCSRVVLGVIKLSCELCFDYVGDKLSWVKVPG
jgi:hypothetical protein